MRPLQLHTTRAQTPPMICDPPMPPPSACRHTRHKLQRMPAPPPPPPEEHTPNDVLIAGLPGSGRRSLRRAIARGQAAPPAAEEEEPLQPQPWVISNKYYTAHALLHVVDAAQRPASDRRASAQPHSSAEAVVLVFDATQPHTLSAAQRWYDERFVALEEQGDEGPSSLAAEERVQLLVATHADALEAHGHVRQQQQQGQQEQAAQDDDDDDALARRPAWVQEAISQWCVERQFEYVECCLTDAALDAALRLAGDRQGVARVIEALHAHVWPRLVRQPVGRKVAAVAAAAAAVVVASPPHDDGGKSGQQQQDGGREGWTQFESAGEDAAGSAAAAAGRPQGDGGGLAEALLLGKEEDEEGRMDAYERLMEEMAGARAELAGLDDAARRERAAGLALKFLALMGGDGDGEEDEDEEGTEGSEQ